MPQGGNSNQPRSEKMHPLFAELYLDSDPDDFDGSAAERRRSRLRRKIPPKQLMRHA
jgi:hypothetical protein